MPEPDTSRTDTVWSQRLRERGMRVTRSRLDVLRVLSASPSPMQAQDVIDALPHGNADRVTVYRTLNTLVESGMAHKVDPGDRVWRYGLLAAADRDASSGPHPHPSAHPHEGHAHFVCDDCGTIRCLEDATIRVSLNNKNDGEKFKITQKDVYLHGTCEKCLEQ